jgi:hypothetical protein
MTNQRRKPRRPARLSPADAERIPGDIDPASRSEAAHTSAQAFVRGGRARPDPEIVERLVHVVEREGLDEIAALWSGSPADTLPGALWRLYLLREWVRADPTVIADRYAQGVAAVPVHDVVAGVVTPTGPREVLEVVDAVLSGVFAGDFAVALERGGAFCRVLAVGTTYDADRADFAEGDFATRMTLRASGLVRTAEELEQAAALWRAGRLE